MACLPVIAGGIEGSCPHPGTAVPQGIPGGLGEGAEAGVIRLAETAIPKSEELRMAIRLRDFSVSLQDLAAVERYIQHQDEHHKKQSFQQEYRDFLRRHGIEWQEDYVWD
jgi:hypothetical protein